MEISEQLGSRSDDMQVDKGEENVEDTRDKIDEMPARRLKLEISDSFLNLIRLKLAWNRGDSVQSKYNDKSKYEELKAAQNLLISGKRSKRIPTEMSLLTLSIGNKKFIRTDECYIFAVFCYQTKKVVCQMRNGKLSRKVDILFSDITSLLVCFEHTGFDTLRIEAKSSFKSFTADKTHPGKFLDWKVDDSKDGYCFPESKFAVLEIEKGMLEQGFAKLLYSDSRLERVVNFARGASCHQGHVHAHTQQTNTFAPHPLPSSNVFPYTGL